MSSANQLRPALGQSNRLCYEFGPFLLDTFQHALLKDGKPVALTPKTYDTLLVFVQSGGRMLSKDELMKTLWPNSFVEESNLTQQVSTIRRVLAESPSDPQYIATVPGRGYRFIAKVRSWAVENSDAEFVGGAGAPAKSTIDRHNGISDLSAEIGIDVKRNTPSIADPHQLQLPKTARRLSWKSAVVGLLALALVALGISLSERRLRARHPQTQVTSLAILPLQNLKQDPDDDFLGFSLADAVITKLGYVSAVTVRPSAAVEPYRNQMIDIRKVATDLNVDNLLIGTFVRDGDDLRITYQLIEGKTDKILGRGTIDLKYDKLLRVQDHVAQQIIKDLELKLSPSELEKVKPDAPVDPLAYEYYLRGVDLHGQHNFPLAIKMLEKSTELDPNYAPAWAYLGASYTSDAAFEFGGREQYRRAEAAYRRALALQPTQLEAQVFLANLFVDTGRVEQAVPLLREALKTNSNNADIHWELGYAYRFGGMLRESVAECERARQIDPFVKSNGSVLNAYLYLGEYDNFLRSLPQMNDSAFHVFYRGFGEYHQKNWEAAAKDFDRAYDLHPDLYTQIGKALSDAIAHRNTDGLKILQAAEERINQRGVGDPEAMYKIAQAYSVLDNKPAALRVLRGSVEAGFFAYPYLATDPLLDPLRQEPQFTDILNVADRRYEAFKRRFF